MPQCRKLMRCGIVIIEEKKYMRKSILKKISTLLISVMLFSSTFTPVYAGTYDSAELIKAVQNILK